MRYGLHLRPNTDETTLPGVIQQKLMADPRSLWFQADTRLGEGLHSLWAYNYAANSHKKKETGQLGLKHLSLWMAP